MVEIKNPLAIWVQISSFSFFLAGTVRRKNPQNTRGQRPPAASILLRLSTLCSPTTLSHTAAKSILFTLSAGNFSDLLIIRICLSSAYIFLFLNSILGAPLWPTLEIPDKIQLDGILWATLNLYVHCTTVVRLLRDERPVQLTEDEEALWRMFFRIGGLSQRMFKTTVARHCVVVTHDKDEKLDVSRYFYILYKGCVKLTVTDDYNGNIVSARKAQSGQLFDFRALGLLDHNPNLAKHRLEAVVTVSRVTLFRFPRESMPTIANHPRTRLMWKELLMENFLRIVQRYFDRRMRLENTADGQAYINPIFLPLEPSEQPNPLRAGSGLALKNPLRHVWASMLWSFAPPWPFQGPPQGLRHNQLLGSGSVQCSIPPAKQLLDHQNHLQHNENKPLLGGRSAESSRADESFMSLTSGEDEQFLEYIHEIDEEMGGMNFVGFKRAVSFNPEED